MRVLAWHVHGAWMTSFVHGPWTTIVPVVPGRGPDGRGRARTYAWPSRAVEATPEEIGDCRDAIDAVLLQRPDDARLLLRWTGLRAGIDVPAVYVEHDCPRGDVPWTRHPAADMADGTIPIVHVTAFNRLMWDTDAAPTTVIEHGILEPGIRWAGPVASLPRAAIVSNHPARRGRLVGADLVPTVAASIEVDGFGMGWAELPPDPAVRAVGDLPHDALVGELAQRRVYVHLTRWTSLGLSLLEAMHLGMPVVALDATATRDAVDRAGIVSADPAHLARAAADLAKDPELAIALGSRARHVARERFSHARFAADWDDLLTEVAS